MDNHLREGVGSWFRPREYKEDGPGSRDFSSKGMSRGGERDRLQHASGPSSSKFGDRPPAEVGWFFPLRSLFSWTPVPVCGRPPVHISTAAGCGERPFSPLLSGSGPAKGRQTGSAYSSSSDLGVGYSLPLLSIYPREFRTPRPVPRTRP